MAVGIFLILPFQSSLRITFVAHLTTDPFKHVSLSKLSRNSFVTTFSGAFIEYVVQHSDVTALSHP